MRKIYCSIVSALIATLAFSASSYGEGYAVRGAVTASGTPVRNASVTFLDNGNSSISYTALTDSSGKFDIGIVTAVKPGPQLPANFQLQQNYPNPFASKTAISYNLDKPSNVRVTIYDVLGRVVKDFAIGSEDAGVHGVIWNGKDNLDRKVAPGVYFYRLQAGGHSQVRKMLFGIGAPNAPVSLSGLIPSGTSGAGLARISAISGESFTVSITNTDSTFPLIVPQQFGRVTISSDSSLNFSILKLKEAVVYADSAGQIIRGFGAANIVGWRPDMTPEEVQTAFGTGPGELGFTILRVRIPPDSTQFSINVPTATRARALGAAIIATPWTPPAWMKTNDNTVGGSIDTNNYAAYAAHLKAFADTMASYGDSVYAVSVQNEPDANVGYESCYWSPTNFLDFMRKYAPDVGVPVFMPESESFNHTFSDPTLNDSLARAHTAFIGGHIYGTSPQPYPLAVQKGKEVWMTEYLINGAVNQTNVDTTWYGALLTARSISDCMNAGMSAYVWWYIVRYYGPIDDGTYSGRAGSVTKKGYVMSQFARFVRPGYHRVYAAYNPQPNVFLTAYSGSGRTVIVVINMNSSSVVQPVVLNNSGVTSFTTYVTSASENCAQGGSVQVSGGTFTAQLAPSSVTTFVSN